MNHAEEGMLLALQQVSRSGYMRVPMSVLMGHSGILPLSLIPVRRVVQAQAEQHANELLNQWSSAKKALLAASA